MAAETYGPASRHRLEMRRATLKAALNLGSPSRNVASILVFMAVVMAVATLAYMAAGWSFTDASYMVVLTVYTVGYGEVRPISTPYLHAVTMSTMVLGCTGMILLTSALVQFFSELQLRRLLGINPMQSDIDQLSDHVIVCGYGRIGLMLSRELADARMPLVVVDRDLARMTEVQEAGHLCLAGDATDEDVLVAAGVMRARVLATVLPDDAANVFITLSAHSLNPRIDIIARGEAPTTENKLRHAGAHHVVLPTHIGADQIARMILFPESGVLKGDVLLEQIAQNIDQLGLRLELFTNVEGSAASGLSVQDAERRGGGDFFIVQIERGAETFTNPAREERIAAGDRLLIVARGGSAVARLLFTKPAKTRVRRRILAAHR